MDVPQSGNGRVEYGRLQQTVEDLREQHAAGGPCNQHWIDIENRMRRVEGFRWQIIGILGAVQLLGVGVILAALRAWMTP